MDNAHASTSSIHEDKAFRKRQAMVRLVEGASDFLPDLDEATLNVLGCRSRRSMMRAVGERVVNWYNRLCPLEKMNVPEPLCLSFCKGADER